MKLKALSVAIAAAAVSSSAFALDFNGYFRAGFGLNADGGSQACYGDGGPNSHVVGRLGNECDTYAELALSQAVVERPTGEKFSIHTLLALGTQEGNTDLRGNSWQGVGDPEGPWSGQRMSFREAYAKYAMASGTEIWAGNRYYGRKDVHINDWYYVNGSGYGFGVDKISVGSSHVAVAVRHTKWKDVGASSNDDANASSNYTSTPQLDLRWNSIDVGLGSLDLILFYGKTNLTDEQEQQANANGYTLADNGVAGTIEWSLGYAGGFNKLVAQYATNGYAWAGYGMNNHLGDSFSVGGAGPFGEDLQDGRKSWRIIDHGVTSFGRNVDMGYSVFYSQLDNPGSDKNGTRYGATIRPRYKWNDTMSTQLELGYYNQEDPWMSESQDLNKVTLAQAWSPLKEKGGFWARPEIRLFVSKFGGDQAREKQDLFYGAQVEAWW